jgi:hypothetical protein
VEKASPMRCGSLILVSLAVHLLSACGAGYNYNPRDIDCSIPPYYSVCAWSRS